MRPFSYQRAESAAAALHAFAGTASSDAPAPAQYLAGGTTLIDLMKLDVMRPERLIDINPLANSPLGGIEVGDRGLRLGALTRMAEAAEHPAIKRDYPVIAQSLTLAASQQLRNMATLGGNVLQRTRCPYFRDTSYQACNKRNPGSGCAALDGHNRRHAVLGVSDQCIAAYAGDFAQAMMALGATVLLHGPDSGRTLPFAALHRLPGATPDVETALQPGELITAFAIPAAPWTRRSRFVKVRDRESYEFALASAAVALDLQDGVVHAARIALGGVATVPWRAEAAEAMLQGKRLDEDSARAAAEAAFSDARPHQDNAFKIALGQRTLMRALFEAAAMEL